MDMPECFQKRRIIRLGRLVKYFTAFLHLLRILKMFIMLQTRRKLYLLACEQMRFFEVVHHGGYLSASTCSSLFMFQTANTFN